MIALNIDDLFGSLIVIGIMTHIAIQVFINIAVVTNTIPPTGIPLPFISYGGTSMLVIMIEMGIVLSISRENSYKIRMSVLWKIKMLFEWMSIKRKIKYINYQGRKYYLVSLHFDTYGCDDCRDVQNKNRSKFKD